MGIEGLGKRRENVSSLEGRTFIIRTNDKVIDELSRTGTVEKLSQAAVRVLIRMLRKNIRDAKVVLVGEGRTMVDARVHSIEVRYASAG